MKRRLFILLISAAVLAWAGGQVVRTFEHIHNITMQQIGEEMK